MWRHSLVNKQLQYTCFPISYNQCSSHIETNQMICCANHLISFYMKATLFVKVLMEYNQRNKSFMKWDRKTLVELYKSFLEWPWSTVAFVVLKILENLFSMEKPLYANNCWRKENYENCPTFIFTCSFRI